jgi:hypothetical protein
MKKGGSAVAGPIWNKFIKEALSVLPNEKFEKPNKDTNPKIIKPLIRGHWQGNENFFIDKISGKLAGEFTPEETTEEKVITNVHSILYWIDRDNILGPAPLDPSNNPQFSHWEIPIQNWWAQNSGKYKITTWAEKPTEVDDVHTGQYQPIISIIEPNETLVYSPDQRIQLRISSSGVYPLQKIDIFINNTFIKTISAPFYFSFIPEELDYLKSENELKIISYDSAFNRAENTIVFNVKQ